MTSAFPLDFNMTSLSFYVQLILKSVVIVSMSFIALFIGLVRRRITAKELADEFNVTVRTIQNDIQALSLGFPIYTKQGGDGGIFVGENYKPYMNTLTHFELKVLQEMYELAEGIHKKVLFQVICKYGPNKLEL